MPCIIFTPNACLHAVLTLLNLVNIIIIIISVTIILDIVTITLRLTQLYVYCSNYTVSQPSLGAR